MSYAPARDILPGWLCRHIYHFEWTIEEAVSEFAGGLPDGAWVLDAGAGEGQYARCFARQRYVGVDLGVGDTAWDYRGLDVVADLGALPFTKGRFDAVLSIVTLEHLARPLDALTETAAVLKRGGRLLLVAPHEWEVHQEPHDYYRYTCHGLRYLLETAGFSDVRIEPVGGLFRLLARRLLNGVQVAPWWAKPFAALFFVPLALAVPLLDGADKRRHFTLGYRCTAQRS